MNASVLHDADVAASTLPTPKVPKFAPTDITTDVVVPLTVIIGLLILNVLVLLVILRLKRRLPDDEPYGEMEELGKILASPDEKLKLDAERI